MKYLLHFKPPDWTHLYIWIAKDLSWTQNWFYPGCIAAAAAVCVSCVCIARSWWAGGSSDTFVHCMTFLWLFANAIWMYGETSDANFPGRPLVYEKCRTDASAVMFGTLAAMGVYYILRCRAHCCGQVSDGSRTKPTQPLQGADIRFIQTPADVSTDVYDGRKDDVADNAGIALLNRLAAVPRHSTPSIAGESFASHAFQQHVLPIQQELLPRAFMRPLFPTWRDYEHLHVSDARFLQALAFRILSQQQKQQSTRIRSFSRHTLWHV
jgi:hypothetical protein